MYGGYWAIARASVKGQAHVESNLPCQDCNGVSWNDKQAFGIAVVSDGAGSASNSQIGSELIVKSCLDNFHEGIKQLGLATFFALPDEKLQGFAVSNFQRVLEDLTKLSDAQGLPLKSLSATALVVVFSNDFLVCTHIGDGRAGYQGDDGDWRALMEPFKGEHANQTIFVTSDIWHDTERCIETVAIREKIRAFCLLTDGCENASFLLNRYNSELDVHEKLNIPYDRFFNPNINALKALAAEGKTKSEINSLWEKFLENGNEALSNEQDDKTMILATRLNND